MRLFQTRCFTTTIVVIVLPWFASESLAQRPTGTIRGEVTDLTGAVLPTVAVVLNSPALITPNLTTTTDSRGTYRFANLEPGVYEVTAEIDGFGPVVRAGLQIVVGVTVQVDFELQPAITETVVVSAGSPVIDVVATTTSEVYTEDVLQSVPNGRLYEEVLNYAPGVHDNSAHGSSVRGNTHRLDGVDVTDPVVGTPFVLFNYDTFEEIQVQTAGRAAEYGQASGAVTNLVTKSGGNQLSGGASLYFGDDALNSTNGQAITDRFPDLESGRFLKLVNPQAQLGGPILTNRVWFFGAYQYTSSDVTQPGFNDALGDPIPRGSEWHYTYGKVTSQLSPIHRLVLAVNVHDFNDDNRGASAFTPVESTFIEDTGAWTTALEWTGIVGRTTAEIRYTGVDHRFDLLPKNSAPRCQNFTTGVAGCSGGQVDLNRRDRRQVHGAASFSEHFAGYHAIKIGGELESSDVWRDLTFNQGLWFNVVDDGFGGTVPATVWTFQDPPTEEAVTRFSFFAQDSWNLTNRLSANIGLRVDRSEGWLPEQMLPDGTLQPETKDIVSRTHFSPRLGVSFDLFGTGRSVVRATYSRYVGSLLTAYFLGVNGNGLAGQLHAYCEGPFGSFCAPGDGELSTVLLSAFGPSSTAIDDALRLPKTDEFTVGYEVELLPSMALGISYIYKREFDLIEDAEVAREFISRTAHDDGDTELDEAGNVVDVVGPQTFTIFDPDFRTPTQLLITNPDQAEREYHGLELTLDKRLSDRWQMHASFVVSESSGLVGTSFFGSSSVTSLFDNPNALINADGKLETDRTYVLKVLGTYQLPYDVYVSGYYRAASGIPYFRTAVFESYDRDGDGINDTPLAGPVAIFAEPRGTRTNDALHIVDLGAEKIMPFSRISLGLRWDIYNLLNADTVLRRRTRTSSAGDFGDPLAFLGARGMRLSARLTF